MEINKLLRSSLMGTLMLGTATAANATHLNVIGPIDAIDGIFASGGGTLGGAYTPGDTDWYIFGANSGDAIQINLDSGPVDPVLAAFYDLSGIAMIGDDPLCNGSLQSGCAPQGAGFDLLFLGFNDDFNGLNSQMNFVAASTGVYAFTFQSFNLAGNGGSYTATVSGNTGSIDSVPEPTTLALFGLGLASFGFARSKKHD